MKALPDFVEAWIDGVATSEEGERLQAWLRADREHARALMRAMRLHQALREGHQGAEGTQAPRARKPSLRLIPRRRRGRAPWAPIAAAACLAIAGLVWMLTSSTHHAAVERESIGRIVAVQGLSSTVSSGGSSSAAGVGYLLAAGDVVAVAEGELVTVSYDDGTRVELSHGARATFSLRDGGKTVDIVGGTVSGSIAKQPVGRPMRWNARDAIATIVGTVLTLDVRASTRLDVSEGRVRFERLRDHASVEVAAGEYADTADAILAAKPLHEPVPQWAAYWSRWPTRPFAEPGYFPIAVWNQDPAQAASYRKLGVNLYVALWQGPTEPQLAQLTAAGMATICAQNEVGLKHRDDPTIVGWFLDEGPDNAKDGKRGRDPAELAAQYRAWSAADPTRPIHCNFGPGVAVTDWIGRGQDTGHVDRYPGYLAATDIASFDFYPIADSADIPSARGQLWRIADGVDHLRDWGRLADAQRGRPVWAMLESGQIRDGGPRPTREQLRAEAWMAIVHGATGICWFCHRFGPGDRVDPAALLRDAEASASVTAIDAEIAAHARALNQTSAEGVSASADAQAPVDLIAKPSSSGLFIAAVAMRERAARPTIRLPWPATVAVVGESRRIDAPAGSFQDSFAPYGVHLYQATPTGH